MPALERLDEDALRAIVVGYRDALRAHQEGLNRLNVYPVPDGDTGTNMALTLESVVADLDGVTGMEATCKAIAHGSLMGARGNSGVILSQILRALAGSFAGTDGIDGPGLAQALAAAGAAAYEAVMKPVEGTILTVARESAAAATATATGAGVATVAAMPGSPAGDPGPGSSSGRSVLVDVLESASGAARAALARTPEQLPVLAEAGVVDAGGAGFCLLLDVMLHVADGRAVPAPEVVDAPTMVASLHAEPTGADLRYEVMFFLDSPDDAIPGFKAAWADLGDSIVVVGGDGIWNCHIHTGDIGAAIEAGIAIGRPSQIRVTDLVEQVDEVQSHQCAESDQLHVSTAVVAVGLGRGIEKVLRELGAQQVVPGGQTMNPSTAQILEAVNSCRADAVIVLPNNGNIVAVAEQVPALTSIPVAVVASKGVVEGVAALLQYDPKADLDANVRSMAAAVAEVVSGEIVHAVRASSSSAGPVREGDWLGLASGDLVVVGPDLAGAACDLLAKLVTDDHELVTMVEGSGATDVDTDRIRQWLAANRPGAAVEIHDWGHPLSAYLFSVE